mmetsp:Transcript_41410/g.53432  ORF Transcript_41410/g.53432 Transcript_41410/m.53432 type:complete len:178 (-) Transcript_41410:22-555(-)
MIQVIDKDSNVVNENIDDDSDDVDTIRTVSVDEEEQQRLFNEEYERLKQAQEITTNPDTIIEEDDINNNEDDDDKSGNKLSVGENQESLNITISEDGKEENSFAVLSDHEVTSTLGDASTLDGGASEPALVKVVIDPETDEEAEDDMNPTYDKANENEEVGDGQGQFTPDVSDEESP